MPSLTQHKPTGLTAALGLLAGLAGCAKPLPITGAPCPCPEEYVCSNEAEPRCVPRASAGGLADAPRSLGRDGAPPGVSGGEVDMQAIPQAIMRGSDARLDVDPDPPRASCGVPPPTAPRRLDHTEWTNTIRDLLGVTPPAPDFQELPPAQLTQTRDELSWPIGELELRQHRDLARQVAMVAVRDLGAILPCDPKTDGDAACGRAFVARFGRRALRRPLRADESDQLTSALDRGRAAGGLAAGVSEVIVAVLSSPSFFVRREAGDPDSMVRVQDAAAVRLRPFEVATRLAYLLTASTPDDTLLLAAELGQLDAAGLRRQAERLLAGPSAVAGLAHLAERWLGLREVEAHGLPSPVPAGFTTPLLRELSRGAERQVAHLVLTESADLKTLLVWPDLVGDAATARFYGLGVRGALAPPWQVLAPVAPDRRFGLLTLPAALVLGGRGVDSRPVHRAMWILQRLLCEDPPSPPPSVNTTLPASGGPNGSTRERHEEHDRDPACRSCHVQIDPIGFGLENYDGLGRWRDTEKGKAVDATGQVSGFRFDGPGGLAGVLSGELAGKVTACVARRWYEVALGQDNVDACTLAGLTNALSRGQGKLRALLVGLIESEAFVTRRLPP